jgi:hypothetical protein
MTIGAVDGAGTADASLVRVRTLTADVSGGAVSLSGDIGLASGTATALDGRVRGLRVHDLLRAYAPDVPVTAVVNGSMSARGDALDWQQWRSTANLQFSAPAAPLRSGAWPLDGVATATLDQRRWRLEANVASPKTGVAVALLDGTLAPVLAESSVRGTVRVDLAAWPVTSRPGWRNAGRSWVSPATNCSTIRAYR